MHAMGKCRLGVHPLNSVWLHMEAFALQNACGIFLASILKCQNSSSTVVELSLAIGCFRSSFPLMSTSACLETLMVKLGFAECHVFEGVFRKVASFLFTVSTNRNTKAFLVTRTQLFVESRLLMVSNFYRD